MRRGWSPGKNIASGGRPGSQRCRRIVVQEQADQPDVDTLLPPAGHGWLQVGQVALEDGPADLRRRR